MASEIYSNLELEKVKRAQTLAYEAARHVEAMLHQGMTEIEAAQLLEDFCRQAGCDQFFHLGFAWFGDRSRFLNFKRPGVFSMQEAFALNISSPELPHFGQEFMPSNRRLEPGMAVILDIAPTVDGYAADIGYSCIYGENAEVSRAIMDLAEIRNMLLEDVRAEKPQNIIYMNVHNYMKDLGYENCHALYPGGVLGHKVGKLEFGWLPKVRVNGFHPQAFLYLLKHKVEEVMEAKNQTPLWGYDSKGVTEPGLWAIEPHMGKNDFGVKFEEIMVVTSSDAWWLDDNLPHVKKFIAMGKNLILNPVG